MFSLRMHVVYLFTRSFMLLYIMGSFLKLHQYNFLMKNVFKKLLGFVLKSMTHVSVSVVGKELRGAPPPPLQPVSLQAGPRKHWPQVSDLAAADRAEGARRPSDAFREKRILRWRTQEEINKGSRGDGMISSALYDRASAPSKIASTLVS